MVKSMTNGEYLRLCQKRGVAPVYLDEKPKQQKQATPGINMTSGHGFVLVTPTELPNPEETKPHTRSKEPFSKGKRKKRKRSAAKKRRREHSQRVARTTKRSAEHDRLAKGRWATGALRT